MNKENMSEITISLFRDVSKAISNLTPDRALLYLTESAVTVTNSFGALLLSPHEKNNIMVPFVKSFLNSTEEPEISESFLKECYDAFLRIYDDIQVVQEYQQILSEDYPENDVSIWPVTLSGKPQALLVLIKRVHQQDFNEEYRSLSRCFRNYCYTVHLCRGHWYSHYYYNFPGQWQSANRCHRW